MATFSSSHPKLWIAGKALLSFTIPAAPILYWYKTARDDRAQHLHTVQTKIRIPNVQTIDDLLIEKCQPGDVILFDRRCDRCAAGPLAAFACIVNRSLVCDDKGLTRAVETGTYDHCGIIVPGRNKFDPLMLLESTPGEGIISRSLLTRLEMSRSRSVILLPLSSPNEKRNDDDYEPTEKTIELRRRVEADLDSFRNGVERVSQQQTLQNIHSLASVVGAISYAIGLQEFSPSPISLSAWVVVSALQACNAAENISGREALDARVEDFLRDGRFEETDAVRLRPGWKFLRPVTMRETSRS